jgi:phosphatidyl-myo-inositol dimannoside synthase
VNSTKILIISSEFPPQPGGIGTHAFHLARSLDKVGKQLSVLSDNRSNSGEEEKAFDRMLSFHVKRIARQRILFLSYVNRVFKGFGLAAKNDTIIASGKFSLWLGWLLSYFYHRKYIAVVHGTELLLPSRILRRFTHRCLKRYHTVIAVSNYTRSLLIEAELKHVVVIPNGFELIGSIEPKNSYAEKKGLQLITVGNVTGRKGQHNVIKAMPSLLNHYPNLTYHIVGIPTEKERLLELSKTLEVDGNIVFHGKVSESEKVELLLQSHLFMMLSEATDRGDVEGFGIAILEANALGLPAIGSKNTGIEDAIDHGKSGFLVDAGDTDQVVKAVRELLESYQSYSANAKKWSTHFKWDIIVEKYLEVLDNKS